MNLSLIKMVKLKPMIKQIFLLRCILISPIEAEEDYLLLIFLKKEVRIHLPEVISNKIKRRANALTED